MIIGEISLLKRGFTASLTAIAVTAFARASLASDGLEPNCARLYDGYLNHTSSSAPVCKATDTPQGRAVTLIETTMDRAICDGKIKDAVVLIGNSKGVLYHRGFNTRGRTDLQYDLASLTKPIATATAVMKLVEESKGKIRLEDSVSAHIPILKGKGIDYVTIGDLLRHRARIAEIDGSAAREWSGLSKDAALDKAALAIARDTRARSNELEQFRYRDSAYVLLAELIQEKTGDYEAYVKSKVLIPLGMQKTEFRANPGDGLSRSLKGASGNAGLFSTAEDLSKYARMMLTRNSAVLSPSSLRQMTEATDEDRRRFESALQALRKHDPAAPLDAGNRPELHSAGFDMDPFSMKGRNGFSDRAFGHTGFSGTSVLIDPDRDLYVIVLAKNTMQRNTPFQERISANKMAEIRRTISRQALILADPAKARTNHVLACYFSPDSPMSPPRSFKRLLNETFGIGSSGSESRNRFEQSTAAQARQ